MFSRLVVLLDSLAPRAVAFAHALQWHRLLHVPLHAIALAGWRQREEASRTAPPAGRDQNGSARLSMSSNDESDPLRACVALCEQDGDALDITFTTDTPLRDGWNILHPDDLLLFGQGIPLAARTWLLRQALTPMAPAVLVCPDDCSPLARVLVLDQGDHATEPFLVRAVQLATELQTAAIVLTVARTEREALFRQQKARRVLSQAGLGADFDFVVGSEVRAAVAHVARWRRSPLIMLERPNLSSWGRWLRGNTLVQLFGELGSLAVLSLPNPGEQALIGTSANAAPAGG